MAMAEATGSKFDIRGLDEDLKEVTEWFRLGLRLDIKHADLKKIELNHKHEGVERCMIEMLAFWKNNCRNATLKKLTTALEEINLRSLAKQLREKCNVPQTDNINRQIVIEPDELLNPSNDHSKELIQTKCMINQLDKEVRHEYTRFTTNLHNLFKIKGVSVNDAIFTFAHLHDESDITSDMREATDVQAFLLALKKSQSWYNYDTTASLADLLCGDEGNKLVETYENTLKVHLKKRREAFETKTRQFVVKVDDKRERFTEDKIIEFRSTIARLMDINYKDLILRSIKDGCVEVTYLFSLTHDVSKIKSAIGEHSNELEKEQVILVSIDGEVVWSQSQLSGTVKGKTMTAKQKRLRGLSDMHAIGSKTSVSRPLKTRSAKPAQTYEKPVKIPSKTSRQEATTANKSKDTEIESKKSFSGLIMKKFKAFRAIAGRFNKTKDASASYSKSKSQNKLSRFQRLRNGLGNVLKGKPVVIKALSTMPYKIFSSISTCQMNFLLFVFIIAFGLSMRSDISKMYDNTLIIQRETQAEMKHMLEQLQTQEKMQEKVQEKMQPLAFAAQDVLSRVALQGAIKVTKGASKLVGKAAELAERAAQLAGDTYQSLKTLMGGWLNSTPPGDPSSESGTV